jgi:ABC-type uncharacterized transport system involved in gliding motility auxiliary subunit
MRRGRNGHTRGRDIIVAAVAVVLVGTVLWWTSDHDAQVDLSANSRFSLSADSRRLIGQVHAPLHVTVFVNNTSSSAVDARFLLDRYHELNHRITFQIADPDTDPALARRYGITNYSTVVVEYQGRRIDAPDAEEAELSTALLEVQQGSPVTVCVLTGHGEDDLSDTSSSGFSSVATLLKTNDYNVVPLDMTTGAGATRQVPPDCAAVLVDGARNPLLPAERAAINAYTAAGGRLAVLATQLSNDDPNPMLNQWGVHFVGGLVIDPQRSAGTDLSNLIIEDLPSLSPVDAGVSQLEFPAPAALATTSNAANGLTVEDLAATSGASYVAPDPNTSITFHAGDPTGPITVAAAADASRVATNGIVRTRVFVTGTDLWATNEFLNTLGNRRLLVNAMAWLTQRNQLLVATSRPADTSALPFTAERQTQVIEIAIVLIPGGILILGALRAWWRRRRSLGGM